MKTLLLALATLCALPQGAAAQVIGPAHPVDPPSNPLEATFADAYAEIDLSETSTGVLAQRGTYLLSPTPYDGALDAPALTGDAWSVLYWQFTESYAAAPTIPTVGQIRSPPPPR